MKKRAKRLQLSKETLYDLNLRQATGGVVTRVLCPPTQISACVTDCPACGNTNYITCLCSVIGC